MSEKEEEKLNEGHELVVTQPAGQLATRANPMDALALMSEQEFEQRLQSLKLAQHRMEMIQRSLMKENVDYGVIPGTGGKPTLLKPGTETLCKFHHLVPTFGQETILGDGVTRPHIRILATCSLHYESEDGPIVAQGMGAANSWEKKYRWREGQRLCPTCGAAAIIKGKAEFGGGWLCWNKKGGCGAKFGDNDPSITEQQSGQIENPDPFDLENTLQKMAAKRAQTDATLRATATSGLFSQDLEDLGDMPETNSTRPAPRPTNRPAQQTAKPDPPKADAKTGEVIDPPKTEPARTFTAADVPDSEIPAFPNTGAFVQAATKEFKLSPTALWQEIGTLTGGRIKSQAGVSNLEELPQLWQLLKENCPPNGEGGEL